MNGEMFNLACLVRAARNRLSAGTFDYKSYPHIDTLTFEFTERLGLFRMKKPVVTTADDWFRKMIDFGLENIHLLINTDDNNRHMQGYVNTKPIMALTMYNDKTLNYWQPKWEYSQESGKWNVKYTEYPSTTAPVDMSFYGDTTDDLFAVLAQIANLADRIGAQGFKEIFVDAIKRLQGEDISGSDDEMLSYLPAMSERGRRLFAAAAKADVFGGMGSWNDSPPYLAQEKGLKKEYDELSEQLWYEIKVAVMSAVNE